MGAAEPSFVQRIKQIGPQAGSILSASLRGLRRGLQMGAAATAPPSNPSPPPQQHQVEPSPILSQPPPLPALPPPPVEAPIDAKESWESHMARSN
eukprot:5713811-Prymnesium_polylepis.1